MKGHEIRQKFLAYFERNGHKVVRSSSLVPSNDPTLLFTNAGMNQFKDVFLGLEQREYGRAASSQKCVRAGGKHNDLDNVGRTLRHHTFFEMLGNFSFGDYFKREAIAYAWELLTQDFKLSPEKLFITVFGGAEIGPGQTLESDRESAGYWKQTAPGRPVFEIPGTKENFWAMGDTGPCGPCSEVFYDFGPEASELSHKDCKFPCDCGRYVELWNLVFMQFNRDASGQLAPLPRPCVDTGAGLERVAAALQGKISNFDTDLLRPLIDFGCALAGKEYGAEARDDVALRILADHSRAAAFLVADGVLPSNEGRGYVLRKIIRRAIDYGRQLGLTRPFLFEMAGRVAELMREPYPELLESSERIATVIKGEEEKYSRLVVPAVERFVKSVEERYPSVRRIQATPHGIVMGLVSFEPIKLHGTDLFYAYDTLGLRPDFVRDLAQEHGWKIAADADRVFENELEKQRQRAKASWKGVGKEVASPIYQKLAKSQRTVSEFYEKTTSPDCRIVALLTKDGSVQHILGGIEAEAVLDHTPFYAEAGGQVGDIGRFVTADGEVELAEVRTTYYPISGVIAHKIVSKLPLGVGDRLTAVVDADARAATMRNHTATHLMHAALRQVLGPHVKQSGSVVEPGRLRFDFTHYAPLDPEELEEVEKLVNEEVLRNAKVETAVMDLDEALGSGALAFFGEKYPEKNVRVVTIPDPAFPRGFFSRELCGGTHVGRTGDIGVFKFTLESSIAAGVRRVEAITGLTAFEHYQRVLATLRDLTDRLKTSEGGLVETVERLLASARAAEKQLESLKRQAAHSRVDELIEKIRTVKDVKVLSARVQDVDREAMRSLVDTLRQKIGSGIIVLGTTQDGKVALISALTKDLTSRLHAGKIIEAVAKRVGGTGGGRADLAEAGGKDPGALDQAIADVYSIVEEMLL